MCHRSSSLAFRLHRTTFPLVSAFALLLCCAMPLSAQSLTGANPYSKLLLGSDVHYYGTTLHGGTGDGTIFRWDGKSAVTVLHHFNGLGSGSGDGSSPMGGLIEDRLRLGTFYGVAAYGGQNGMYNGQYPLGSHGFLYSLSNTGSGIPTFTILHTFSGHSSNVNVPNDGAIPTSAPIQSPDGGYLIGTTLDGGSNNQGT